MDNLKTEVAKVIYVALNNNQITLNEIESNIEEPKDKTNGDFAYPCFKLAKLLRNSPVNIANKIKEKIQNLPSVFSKVEAVSGYLNFYANSNNIVELTMTEICTKKQDYGKTIEGNGQTVVIDYSSPNIAKPFHLGHFRNTVLGRAIYNLYSYKGYNIVGIDYLGDWGRQFGLLIEAYKMFRDEYNIEGNPLETLSKMYVRISNLAKEDESVMDKARDNFKKLEQGDEEYLKLWEYFREISLKEYNRIYDILGCKFDSYNGEAYYNDKMDEVIDILDKKGVLVESQGAKVVNLKKDETPCIIVKSNGSTIYATRDLAAILDRVRTYNYTKNIYVTSYEQVHHFKQVFEVAKHLVDEKYVNGLVHVPYGMVRLKTGKMSTREGTVIYLNDLIEEAINKAYNIIEEKNNELENKDIIAKQVGIGALVFNYVKSNKIKDIIFDLDEALRFDGETGPYIQYTFVRTKSILNKANFDNNDFNVNEVKFELINSDIEIELIKKLAELEKVVDRSANEFEPAILARYLIEVATLFSKFYNECKVLNVEDNDLKIARCFLVYATNIVISNGLGILGIESPEKM